MLSAMAENQTQGLNKVTNVEAQRIRAVLTETVEKVDILSWLSRDVYSSLENPEEFFGTDLNEHLLRLFELGDRYESLLQQKSAYKNDPDRNKFRDYQSEVKELGRTLQQNALLVVKKIKDNADVREKLQMEVEDLRSEQMKLFHKTLSDLRGLTITRLSTTVEEEKNKLDFVSQIISKEKKASAELLNLQRELADAQRDREKEVSTRQATIAKLKAELERISAQTVVDSKVLQREASARENRESKAFNEQSTALREDIAKVSQQLEGKQRTAGDSEYALRRKKNQVEQEVMNWVTKYDQDMGEKYQELQTLKSVFAEESQQLEALEKRYKELDLRRSQLLKEHRENMQVEATEQAYQWKLHEAATAIQALMRGYMERKRFAKRRKKIRKDKKGGRSPALSRSSPSRASVASIRKSGSTRSVSSVKSAKSSRAEAVKSDADFAAALMGPASDTPSPSPKPTA
eukprot:GCRY01003826.1.p1 GENE.GCRY01003826.1~~GCRY01003826.1.p1  ORF type:complete len:462 (-),score=106.51 GCRY01003826.1:305-1690(-)